MEKKDAIEQLWGIWAVTANRFVGVDSHILTVLGKAGKYQVLRKILAK